MKPYGKEDERAIKNEGSSHPNRQGREDIRAIKRAEKKKARQQAKKDIEKDIEIAEIEEEINAVN